MLAKKPVGYWNPKTELMPREQLQQLQLRKLQVLVAFAFERSPFWRGKLDATGVQPRDVQRFEDIQRLPFVTKADFLESQQAHPPYGDFITAPASIAMVYHQTSGTSGKTPLRALDSQRSWQWGAESWACGLYAFGIRSTDVAYLPFGFGSFIGFWGAHYGLQKIGTMTVAGGAQSSEARIRQMIDLEATVVTATPSYAIRLSQVAKEMGIDLAKDSKVEMIVLAGEPGANIPSTKAMIEEAWGAHAGDYAGMTESAGICSFECSEQPGGMHIVEDHFWEEVVDPLTGKWVDYGQKGERVCTSFGRGYWPLIRYRTGDLVERVPGSVCPCGRTFDIYKGGIIGRTDDMKLIRGTNVFPSAIEGVVRRYSQIREFQIVLTKVDYIDEITVKLEPNATAPSSTWPDLAMEVGRDLSEAHEGLRFNVEMVAPETLPTFELKAKRLIDRR
ncbi:MAG: phenylacetate--CoA ligase family protein [Chloroflexi bacterium]|nr:phenylacetate--CoA ligase family protein [Chloroflexota bacterium]